MSFSTMDEQRKITQVRQWFRDHHVTRTDYGDDFTVIDWRKPGTRSYSVRYVFDVKNACCTITGDLGEAVVWPCWESMTPEQFVKSFHAGNMHYFFEKLKCSSDRYEWNVGQFRQELTEKVGQDEYELIDELEKQFSETTDASCQQFNISGCNDSILYAADADYGEWLYTLGRSYQIRLYAWVVGMQMAYEQMLKKD